MSATQRLKAWQVFCLILGLISSNLRAEDEKNSKNSIIALVKVHNYILPAEFDVRMDPKVCAPTTMKRRPEMMVVNKENSGLRDVIGWLETLEGPGLPKEPVEEKDKPSAVIEIQGCTFKPRIVVIGPGELVRFKNMDDILYKVRSAAKKNKNFNRAFAPQQSFQDLRFYEPETVPIRTDHPWMHAYVVVRENALAGASNANGEIIFRNVPAGTYRLKLWHELLGQKNIDEPIRITTGAKRINIDWDASAP